MEDMISWMQEGGQVSKFIFRFFRISVASANPFFFINPNLVLGRDIGCNQQYQETKEYADENG